MFISCSIIIDSVITELRNCLFYFQGIFSMFNELKLIGRTSALIEEDVIAYDEILYTNVKRSRFLVIGGAGSIGQAVTKEIFKRNPLALHVVDLSENNLVELVRDLRSSYGYIKGDFQTFALDCGSFEFEKYFRNQEKFDYVLNLSALKHVRSERDVYTLMRMIQVNILNTIKTIELSIESGVKKYFCVSTDKAANPVNMMGASKRIMELFLFKYSEQIDISTARFANVAFSDGSLLQGFTKRFEKKQPIAAPNDIKRYFINFEEAGQLCLMSTLLGNNRDIYFPKLSEELNLVSFSDIARTLLKQKGFKALECKSEEDARKNIDENISNKKWPCFFTKSDTTGEKNIEEFYTNQEEVNLEKYKTLGIVKNKSEINSKSLEKFSKNIELVKSSEKWYKNDVVMIFQELLPYFKHHETQKNLDQKM